MNVYFLPMPRVLIVAFRGAQTLDITGPGEVFAAANRELGRQHYRVALASLSGGSLPASSGLVLHTQALQQTRPLADDTVIVAGGEEQDVVRALETDGYVAWLKRASGRVHRLASVCTGAFLLAASGVLDGKRAATHWQACDRLQQFRPQVNVDRNAIFVEHERVWTSAGVTTGIDMALAMVSSGISRAEVEDPQRDVAFPDSVIGFFAGDLGQPPGGFPKELQKKVLKGRKPLTERPGSYLEDVDLEAERSRAAEETGMEIDDFRLASYLMYPKVFCEFAKTQDRYGPTAVLPTPTYFYGLEQGEELLVDIEKGKTLVLQYLGQSETNEKGQVRVFFDLNGQPRTITVPDRMKAGDIVLRPKAESGDPKQVGAPMPGVVSSLAVKPGQTVAAGDVLCSIEAMKMETAIHAETGGVLAEVLVKPGDQIDAKDLMMRFE